VRRYWDYASGGKPRPTNRNLGAYLSKMEKRGYGDAKVMATLKTLTLDDAINLLGIVRSAISAMLAPLPNVASAAPVAPAVPASTAAPAP